MVGGSLQDEASFCQCSSRVHEEEALEPPPPSSGLRGRADRLTASPLWTWQLVGETDRSWF